MISRENLNQNTMKSILITFLAYFFFTTSTIAGTISPKGTSCLPVVLDSVNNNLRTDGRYYVVYSFSKGAGGVSRGPNNQLLQSPDEVEFGTPVVFKPMKPTTEVEITESTPLNIVFDTPSSTPGSNSGTVWKVEGFPGPSPYFLSSNGVEGNQSDVSSWFQIKRINYFSYKLVFCPNGGSCDCKDVKVDGERRLVLAPRGTTFLLLFLKVKDFPIPPVAIDSYHFDLRFDRRYFVVNSLGIASSGGVIRSGPNNQLVMSASPVDYGMSIVFKPQRTKKQVELVTESTPLNIVFYTGSYNSTKGYNAWKVEGFPGTGSSPFFLSSNGVAGDTKDVSSWFQIKKSSYFSFKLVFCPYKNVTNCSEVGFDVEERRLVLTTDETNFPIVFVPDESSIGKLSI